MNGENNLALIAHGFADDYLSPWWRPVRDHFREWDYDILEIDFDGLGRTINSPVKYAQEVKEVIDAEYDEIEEEFDPDEIVVASHSMGGLTARYAIEELGYDREVDVLITFGTPHQGSCLAKPFGWAGIDGARDISPGSDFLADLNDDGVSEYVDYLNIYSPNDPVFIDTDRARLPEADNVTNVAIGQTRLDLVGEKISDSAAVLSAIADDYMRDVEDLVGLYSRAVFQPWELFNPDNQLRATDPRLVALRATQLYNAAKVDPEEVLTGHLSIFYNDRTWREVGAYLEASSDHSGSQEVGA